MDGLFLGAAIGIPFAALILGAFTFVRTQTKGYESDMRRQFKECHEERLSLTQENKRLREQNLELMLALLQDKAE